MIKIGTVNGDVIEAGGVKNVTNNYYGKREEQPTKDLTLDAETEVPEELRSEEAEEIWEDLREAGFIVEDGYGLAEGVSTNTATYIADRMSERLGIKAKWKPFQQLWNKKNMAQLAGTWKDTGKLPPRVNEIDDII